MYHLQRALDGKRKENPGWDLEKDKSPFSIILRDLFHYYEYWPYDLIALIDVNNWNLETLSLSESCYRKPRVCLQTLITSKGNLALDWYPDSWYRENDDSIYLQDTQDFGDFQYWSNDWPQGYPAPFNRIVFLHEFGVWFSNRSSVLDYTKSDRFLAEAVKVLLHNIYHFLGNFLDVRVCTDLYIKEDAGTKSLIQVRSVKEVEKGKIEKERKQWIEKTFINDLGITPERLLEVYKKCEEKYPLEKYTQTAIRLSSEVRSSLSGDKVKRLLTKIHDTYPTMYFSVFEESPERDRRTNRAKPELV
jgi:hypothetical protein